MCPRGRNHGGDLIEPGVRAFLDALAEAVARSVLRDQRASVTQSDPRPRANATPGLTTEAYVGGDHG